MTRLIDADALKKTIAKFHKEENERLHNPLWDSIGLNALNRLIDKAPTVDTDLSKYSDKLWKEAYERGKNERPHGKWELHRKDLRVWFECSHCGAYNGGFETDFCPICGADMRGDKE